MISNALNEQSLTNQAIESLHFMQRRVTIPLSDSVQALLKDMEDKKYYADRRVQVIEWACCHETCIVLLPDGSHQQDCYIEVLWHNLGIHSDPLVMLGAVVHYQWEGRWRMTHWNVAGLMDLDADRSAVPADETDLTVVARDRQLVAV